MTAEYHRNPLGLRVIAGVDAGRYDIVLNNVAPTEERKKKYDFSVPYAHSRARVGVKKDSSLKNASEISGHSAAQSATSNYRKLVEERGATIIEVTGFDEAIEQVLSGRAEMTANDSVSFAEYFKSTRTLTCACSPVTWAPVATPPSCCLRARTPCVTLSTSR